MKDNRSYKKRLDELAKTTQIPLGIDEDVYFSDSLVQNLDLVYCTGGSSGENYGVSGLDIDYGGAYVEKQYIKFRKIIDFPRKESWLRVMMGSGLDEKVITQKLVYDKFKINDLCIFGAIELKRLDNWVMTPIFNIGGIPKGENIGSNIIRYQGLAPERLYGGYLGLEKNEWRAGIDINKEGKGSVYLGQWEESDAIIFKEPLQFDRDKSLLYARSPNDSMTFKNILGERVLKESQDTKNNYYLIYDDPKELRDEKIYAINDDGITWNNNTLLRVEMYLSKKIQEEENQANQT